MDAKSATDRMNKNIKSIKKTQKYSKDFNFEYSFNSSLHMTIHTKKKGQGATHKITSSNVDRDMKELINKINIKVK